jgi:hypothetical protein
MYACRVMPPTHPPAHPAGVTTSLLNLTDDGQARAVHVSEASPASHESPSSGEGALHEGCSNAPSPQDGRARHTCPALHARTAAPCGDGSTRLRGVCVLFVSAPPAPSARPPRRVESTPFSPAPHATQKPKLEAVLVKSPDFDRLWAEHQAKQAAQKQAHAAKQAAATAGGGGSVAAADAAAPAVAATS